MKLSDSLFPRSGVVDKLSFGTATASGDIVFENLQIFMLGVQNTSALTADFEANYDGVQPICVLNVPSYEAEIVDYWFTIDIENTYFLNGRFNQIIEFRFTNNTGTLAGAPLTLSVGGTVAYDWGPDASTSTTAGYTYDRLHNFALQFETDIIFDPLSGAGNSFPFGADIGHSGIFQMKYNMSLIPDTGIIDKIWFPVNQFSGDVVYENLVIRLAESPQLGALSHTDFESNFAGAAPITVLDEAVYHVRNLGGVVVIDIDNVFHYNGEHDLLIEMRWDSLVSGYCTVIRDLDMGGYRAWDLYWSGQVSGNDTRTNHMYIDFAHSESSVEYGGSALVDATRYYWRVRTCDSTGIWSDWINHNFKYEVLSSVPEFTTPIVNPDPAIVNQPVTVSLNVTYFLGISEVLLEFDGANHTMTPSGDTYSYTWTPTEVGNVTYTIYMESNVRTSDTVSGYFDIVQPGLDLGPMTIWIIAGAMGVVLVIVIVVLLKRKGNK